jgi:hypothetical protein
VRLKPDGRNQPAAGTALSGASTYAIQRGARVAQQHFGRSVTVNSSLSAQDELELE